MVIHADMVGQWDNLDVFIFPLYLSNLLGV